MQQMDFLDQNNEIFLYNKLERVEHSMDKRCRAIFSLINELQDQILQIKQSNFEKKAI